jgi:S-DNA-T family DNA segregation ATPase FtsK/SpoIIIE
VDFEHGVVNQRVQQNAAQFIGVVGLVHVAQRAEGILLLRREAQKKALEKKHAKSAAERQGGADAPLPVTSAPRATIPLDDFAEIDLPPARPRVSTRPALPRPSPPQKQQQLLQGPPAGGYALPPLELLNDPVPQEGENEKDLLARAQLSRILPRAVLGGSSRFTPARSSFEFAPEAGVRYSKIVGLVDDLCLGLKAESIRIDRIPGRSTVGIEVPNKHQEVIFPRELMASEKFRHSKSKLTLALGKDINGDVFAAELERMPHLRSRERAGNRSVSQRRSRDPLRRPPAEVAHHDRHQDDRQIMPRSRTLIPRHRPEARIDRARWACAEWSSQRSRVCGVRNIEQFNQALNELPGRTSRRQDGRGHGAAALPYIVIVTTRWPTSDGPG